VWISGSGSTTRAWARGVEPHFLSWNPLERWLRQVEVLRLASW